MDEKADDRDPQCVRYYRIESTDDPYIDTFGNVVDREKEQERKERGYLDNTGTLKVYIDRDGSFGRFNEDYAVSEVSLENAGHLADDPRKCRNETRKRHRYNGTHQYH